MENQTVYTEQFRGKSSSYFLDLKTSEKAGYYLVLSQSSKDKEQEGGYQTSRLRIFANEIDTFHQAFERLMESYHDNKKIEGAQVKGKAS